MKLWQVLLFWAYGISAFAQGQVVFANKVGNQVDAPVIGNPVFNPRIIGPGPDFSAQLFLRGTDGSLTPLLPASTFYPAGTGAAAIADRYWKSQTVDVPVPPGTVATFVVGVWRTSLGSYEAAKASGLSFGQSAPFSVAVGGGILPPANLTSLQAFTINALITPEPSSLALCALGAVLLVGPRRIIR